MGTNSIKENILQFLLEHNQSSFSISEISKAIKKDYKNTYEAIKSMPSINIFKSAGANHVSFNFEFSEVLFLVETNRKKEILKDKNLKIIIEDISKINTQFILLLFGSRAKKTNYKKSDYDLLLITDNPEKIESKFSIYPLNIDLNTIKLNEFKQMLLSKEFTFVSEAIKNNIILWGIEDYYRLIKNAK